MRKITIPSLVAAVVLLSMLFVSAAFTQEKEGDSKGSSYKTTDYEPDRYQILNINNLWTWMRSNGISASCCGSSSIRRRRRLARNSPKNNNYCWA